MVVITSIAAVGFIVLVDAMDERVNTTDSVNLTGISYNSDIYNATNETTHGLSNVMPNFIWLIIIFFIVVFLTILTLALKQR